MKPSSFSWLLSVNSTREPDERREHVAFLRDVVERQHAGREQDAEPEKRDRRRVEPERRRRRPQRHHADERDERRSSRRGVSGPSAASAWRAAAGASRRRRDFRADDPVEHERQRRPSPTSVGTDAASSHEPNPISTPTRFAISAPSGLAAIAVSHSADDSAEARHAGEHQEAAEAPPVRVARASRPPPRPARTRAGYSTPDRAVLLGNAGAISASTRKMLYDSPSVDRPNTLTIRWPSRAPSPHFTTARATRNATTMSRIVAFANPHTPSPAAACPSAPRPRQRAPTP